MQPHETTIAELTTCVETLTEEQYQPVQRCVWEMRFGMIAGGSVWLSAIGRQLERETALRHIEKRLSRQVAATVSLPGRLAIRHRDRRGRWHTVILRDGHPHVTWDGLSYWLVVVEGLDEKLLWLGTNIPVLMLARAEQILRAYLRCWRGEDAARLLKQEFGLEHLRVAR